ncbi:uncharacterized protein LOC144120018 [Amblyomma americanum]
MHPAGHSRQPSLQRPARQRSSRGSRCQWSKAFGLRSVHATLCGGDSQGTTQVAIAFVMMALQLDLEGGPAALLLLPLPVASAAGPQVHAHPRSFRLVPGSHGESWRALLSLEFVGIRSAFGRPWAVTRARRS